MKLTLSRLAVAAVVVTAAVAAFATGPAGAFTVSSDGCPGSIQVPTTNGGYNGGYNLIEFPQRFVWRSPCYPSSAQVIKVTYRMWGYDFGVNRWVNYWSTPSTTATAPAGTTGIWINYWSTSTQYRNFSTDVVVEWHLTNGALIGWQRVNYNAISDYSCGTGQYPPCRVYSDPNVGAYMHFVF